MGELAGRVVAFMFFAVCAGLVVGFCQFVGKQSSLRDWCIPQAIEARDTCLLSREFTDGYCTLMQRRKNIACMEKQND